MRRMVLSRSGVRTVLLITLMVAAMMISAAVSFAATSEDASCKGQFFSSTDIPVPEGSNKGQVVSEVVRQEVGEEQSCNPNAAPQGGGPTTAG